ncbi:MAG TPA: hypothetical protein VF041_14425 [Gemmatimonadaceae bacterium]
MRRRLVGLFAGSLALPLAALRAQANPDSVKQRNDCRRAAQAIRTGEPGPKTQWAWDLIPACTESGAASAAALRQLRHDPDSTHFAPVQVVGFNVRAGGLFAAALEVAGDRGATNVAREASFIISDLPYAEADYHVTDAHTGALDASGSTNSSGAFTVDCRHPHRRTRSRCTRAPRVA